MGRLDGVRRGGRGRDLEQLPLRGRWFHSERLHETESSKVSLITSLSMLLFVGASATAQHYPVYGRVTPCWENASLASLPFCNPKLDATARARDLVARFTTGEKIAQLGNSGENAVARLGVDLYQYHSEGLHGVRTGTEHSSRQIGQRRASADRRLAVREVIWCCWTQLKSYDVSDCVG